MIITDETRLKIMFKNRELVGHMVGGAVIGVAVGMVIQKMLSPRTLQPSAIISEKRPSRKSVKKRSRSKNLQTPSHRRKDHCNRHSRSKSACQRPKDSKDENYSSVSTKSSAKSKLSSSQTDLRSRSENLTNISKSDEKYKIIEKLKLRSSETKLRSTSEDISKNNEKSKLAKNWSNSLQFILDKSKEHLPIKWNNSKDTLVSLLFDINNRKSLVNFSNDAFFDKGLDNFDSLEDTCDRVEKDAELFFYRESFGTMSTEYFPIVLEKNVKNSESTVLIFDENNHAFTSVDCLENGDKTIDSIIATCATKIGEYSSVTSNILLKNFRPINPIFDEKNNNFTPIDSLEKDDATIYSVISTCATMTKEFDLYYEEKHPTDQKFVTFPTLNISIREPTENDEE